MPETDNSLPQPAQLPSALTSISIAEDLAPMLDVHAPHQPTHTWRDFFIHIATIVVGLLIAVALEQTLEAFHRHHQSYAARAAIESELLKNLQYIKENEQHLAEQQRLLQQDLQTVESSMPDAEAIPARQYKWYLQKPQNAAWTSAKVNGSLALIAPSEIAKASYFHETEEADNSIAYSYFTDMDSASALIDDARSSGSLTPAVRQ
ncbi:MAG TPA: hypothetical protein VHW25_14135 [Steroidobacteraceae bacterium]|jgi:hypothetical protein|nr:hypothetical protein [Steroidobacteraceae bacterium]